MRIKILKGLFGIATVAAMISACAMDSESNAPCIVCGISLAYIGLIVLVNTKGVE